MAWKYVMIKAKFGDLEVLFPVIFPDKMVHIEVATVIKMCGPLDGHDPQVVSAGKIEGLSVDWVGGDSETLRIKSRDEDHTVITMYPYLHGIVS